MQLEPNARKKNVTKIVNGYKTQVDLVYPIQWEQRARGGYCCIDLCNGNDLFKKNETI